SCAVDLAQIDTCDQVFATLVEGETPLGQPESDGTGIVRLRGESGGRAHLLICRFGGPPLGNRHLDLLAVELDGEALPEYSMIALRETLGLATPASLIAPPSSVMTPGLAGAYFVQQLVNGISAGAILALVATGYSLIYGITGA